MIDRDKVIKALERCLICDMSVIATEEAQKAYRECEYTVGLYCGQKKLLRDALALLQEQEAVEPVKTCASKSELGVDGLLIVGNCPVCGQSNINNSDNKFCGGCGRPIYWTRITNKYGLLKGR